MFYFCVACELPGHERIFVEVLAKSEKHAMHKASLAHPDREYRVLVPEPVVKYDF